MSIEFCSLSSSSSGNCHFLRTKDTNILIDAGFSGKRVEELLGGIDASAGDLDGIMVTHEHGDHIKGVGVLSRRYNIPIFANKGTWEGMEPSLGKIREENIRIIETDKYFNFRDLDILPMKIYHDTKDPVGYIINQGRKKVSVVTDTGKLDDRIIKNMEGSDLYLLESNHDIQMLRTGPYAYHLQERIRGDLGHLSNPVTAEALASLVRAQGEVILLGHLSKDNNNPRTAFNETAFRLMDLGLDLDRDVKLELTYRDRQTKLYRL